MFGVRAMGVWGAGLGDVVREPCTHARTRARAHTHTHLDLINEVRLLFKGGTKPLFARQLLERQGEWVGKSQVGGR